MGDDLSDYERLRLENIKRNAEFLSSLGIQDVTRNFTTNEDAGKNKSRKASKHPQSENDLNLKIKKILN
jgi:hypothetical protein